MKISQTKITFAAICAILPSIVFGEDDGYLYDAAIITNYSEVTSIEMLDSSEINYWCMLGANRSLCTCPDPLIPTPQGTEFREQWPDVQANHAASAASATDVDVVFFGDSITEGWNEVFWEEDFSEKLGDVKEVFAKYFSKEDGAKYQALPLGIAADTTPNLLWRLQNGELPESLNPAVFWVLIGTNDFKTGCSAETIIMGIIRVVEEIRSKKPSSTVVINQVFPRSKPYNMDGYVYAVQDNGEEPQPILQNYIDVINQELESYSASRVGVEFYSTDIFWVDPDAEGRNKQINTTLMPDVLHPYANGYELWAQEIVSTLDAITGGYLYDAAIITDYSEVTSIEMLDSSEINYWCMSGANRSLCTCPDPLIPTPQGTEFREQWPDVQANHAASAASATDVDVVFFGDSITEGWNEVFWEEDFSEKLGDVKEVFAKYFSKEDGAKYQALPLGIAADTTPNLLWRLQNGELPESLNPAVFWVLIGTNDFKTGCSAETIIMGIIRVVEEIRSKKPSSTVVINQVFPRSKPYNMDGYVYAVQDNEEEPQPILQNYIDVINQELESYSASRVGVEFYSTDIFWVNPDAEGRNKQINTTLMPDVLHPYANGYELWAQEIVRKLDAINRDYIPEDLDSAASGSPGMSIILAGLVGILYVLV